MVIAYKNKLVPVMVERPKKPHIGFVRQGEKPRVALKAKEGLLDSAADWIIYDDL